MPTAIYRRAHVSTLLTDIERDWLNVDFVDCYSFWLAQLLVLSNVIDPVWLMCRFCRLRLTLILSCIDFVDCDWHWSAQVSFLSTVNDTYWSCVDPSAVIGPDWWLLCQIFWLRITIIISSVDSIDWGRSTMIGSFVDSVEWNWSWYAHGSNLLNEIVLDLLLSRLFWLWLTLFCAFADYVDCETP